MHDATLIPIRTTVAGLFMAELAACGGGSGENNSTLTHEPSSSGACYTQAAYDLAGTSNLYYASGSNTLSMASTNAISAYLIDYDVSSLGHRRWILFPFFGATSFGRADADGSSGHIASSLCTIGGETCRYANGSSQVSSANATIGVATTSGNPLTVTDRAEDYTGYGLAKSLQWKVSGLATGTTYTVTIANVTVNGATRSFSYDFTL